MTVATWTTFFVLLAIGANAALMAGAGLRLLAGRSPGAARLWEALRAEVAPVALSLAAVVAAVATVGSLYYSEVANFEPCRLCWYQRIAMYPLPVILGVAAWRRDPAVHWYALPLAAIGAAIAAYHYLIQRFPDLDAGACSVGVSCAAAWVERFGFVTIPYMALSAFLLIAALLAVALTRSDPAGTGPARQIPAESP